MAGGRCLVLKATMELIHVTPGWLDGLNLVEKGKAHALAHYDDVARSETQEFKIPAVVVLKRYVRIGRRRPSFSLASKRNVLVRDKFQCAYCGRALTLGTCTKDHVLPLSRGGKDELLNVVACCWICNNKKADRTPSEAGLTLRTQPRHLTDEEKVEVLVKTHRSHERAVWLTCLRRNGLEVF